MTEGTTAGSVVFDQAASFYDQSRALPPETAAAQTALLAGELTTTNGPVLEIGVGTGRVAVPLAQHLTAATGSSATGRSATGRSATGRSAIRSSVIGLDLSVPMLEALVAKGSPVVALRASALRLPIRTGAAGAVIACHVLHLIKDWQQAVEEVLRVLMPGGILLAARGRADGHESELQRRIREAAGVVAEAGQLDDLDGLDAFMRTRRVEVRNLPAIANPATRSVADYLRQVGDNTYSWTWAIPDHRRRQAVADVRQWFTRSVGDPREAQLHADPVAWRRYRTQRA